MEQLNGIITIEAQKGFSLLELLIAALIGSVILASVISSYATIHKSSAFTSNLMAMHQQAQFAFDYMEKHLLMRGHFGCFKSTEIPTGNPATFTAPRFIANQLPYSVENMQGIAGFKIQTSGNCSGGSGICADRLPAAIISGGGISYAQHDEAAPRTLGGSDVISVSYASVPRATLRQDMNSPGSDLKLTVLDGFDSFDNNILTIGNCTQIDVFAASSIANDGVVLSPGKNAAQELSDAYKKDVAIREFHNITFYIADSGRKNMADDNIISLYIVDINGEISELVEGIENLKILYGVTNDVGNISYISADHADFNDRNIVSVQIGMLLRTADQVSQYADEKTYVIAGESVGPPNGNTVIKHSGGKYVRHAFNSTLKLRNGL
jgi:type IV pilus assembly protein PilW